MLKALGSTMAQVLERARVRPGPGGATSLYSDTTSATSATVNRTERRRRLK